jgi:hypothetical protein
LSGVIGFGAVGFPDYARAATIVFAAMAIIGGVMFLPMFSKAEAEDMDDKKKADVIGTDIESSGGTGAEITSHGTPDAPSLGGESIAVGVPGQTVIGTRVVQRGPGAGMRVTQIGPGVGFRSIASSGPPPKKDD